MRLLISPIVRKFQFDELKKMFLLERNYELSLTFIIFLTFIEQVFQISQKRLRKR